MSHYLFLSHSKLTPNQCERALGFWKTGDFDNLDRSVKLPEVPGPNGPKTLVFNDALWGNKTRSWMKNTARLENDRWDLIIEDASPYVDSGPEDVPVENVNGASDAGNVDPHELVEFDWYMLVYLPFFVFCIMISF